MAQCYEVSGNIYEPKELIDLCLACRKPDCYGKCINYSKLERELKQSGRKDKLGHPIGKRGYAPKRYLFRGRMISIPEMAVLVDHSESTVRRMHSRGRSMEEIYVYYTRKTKS